MMWRDVSRSDFTFFLAQFIFLVTDLITTDNRMKFPWIPGQNSVMALRVLISCYVIRDTEKSSMCRRKKCCFLNNRTSLVNILEKTALFSKRFPQFWLPVWYFLFSYLISWLHKHFDDRRCFTEHIKIQFLSKGIFIFILAKNMVIP